MPTAVGPSPNPISEDIINMIAMAVARLCGSAKLWIADNATDPPAAATNVDANWKVNAPSVPGYKKAAANSGAEAPYASAGHQSSHRASRGRNRPQRVAKLARRLESSCPLEEVPGRQEGG